MSLTDSAEMSYIHFSSRFLSSSAMQPNISHRTPHSDPKGSSHRDPYITTPQGLSNGWLKGKEC